MSRSISGLLVFVLAALLVAGCAGGGGGAPKDFSAENVMNMGGQVQRAQVFFAGDKWRIESQMMGQKTVAIIRADKKVMWNLMPDQKMYMEMKLDPKQVVGRSTKLPGELERKKIASETVNGVKSDKYQITYQPNEQSPKMSIYQWLSQDNIPVKTAALDGSWSSEYQNVKVGKQDAALFELPAGYKLFQMPKMNLQ